MTSGNQQNSMESTSSHKPEAFHHLIRQVYALTAGRPLTRGQLVYFRAAIASELHPRFVELVRLRSNEKLFSTLEEIVCMEDACAYDDRLELVVQCCLILELYNNARLVASAPPDAGGWMYEDCRSLEEVVNRRYRLRFIKRESHIRDWFNEGFVETIHRLFLDSEPHWGELLLILKVAGAYCGARMFECLAAKILELPEEVPRSTATLFLSFMSDAVFYLSVSVGDEVCKRDGRFIVKLLELGASPTITREDHDVLLRHVTKKYFRVEGTPWWLETGRLEPGEEKVRPTTLFKLLSQQWNPGVIEKLRLHTCCNLDAFGTFGRNFGSRLISLRCLAARRIPDSDLDTLSPLMARFALKHQPLSPNSIDPDIE